jgi:hypothetical protein
MQNSRTHALSYLQIFIQSVESYKISENEQERDTTQRDNYGCCQNDDPDGFEIHDNALPKIGKRRVRGCFFRVFVVGHVTSPHKLPAK